MTKLSFEGFDGEHAMMRSLVAGDCAGALDIVLTASLLEADDMAAGYAYAGAALCHEKMGNLPAAVDSIRMALWLHHQAYHNARRGGDGLAAASARIAYDCSASFAGALALRAG